MHVTVSKNEAAQTRETVGRVPSTEPGLTSQAISDSPHMTAQRKQLAGAFGDCIQPKEKEKVRQNKTGLPDNLKSGVEALSGISMDKVRVHLNSAKPAQLSALAYAQGTDIHVAPGQEQHLPHEAWHVVQQAQGRVQPTMQMKGVQINDHQGLEKEADVRGEQARSWTAQSKENPALKSEIKVGSQMVQKRVRPATVVWDITHEVFPNEETSEHYSLFGDDDDPFKNEGIELYKGDKVLVDDEKIFQSRRGANQERQDRRKSDKEGHLTNKWLKLEGVARTPEQTFKGYVREETRKIVKEPEPPRKIGIGKVGVEEAQHAGDNIHSAWDELSHKRRRSIGAWEKWEKVRTEKDKGSSPSWDQIAEGADVSEELSRSPKEKGSYTVDEDSSDQSIFTAYDGESRAPIGIIVIEKRATEFPRSNGDSNKKWYLRWLVGHPTMTGAGGLLLKTALDHVKNEKGGTAVWVQSAPSAVGWYKLKGFERLSEEEQEEYDSDFEEGWDSVLMVRVL
jgi:hypothetical protein